MENKRPVNREKRVSNNSAGVHKRGEGLGTGPVGNGKRPSSSGNGGGGSQRSSGSGGKSPLTMLIAAAILLLGGGGGAMSLLGGGSDSSTATTTTTQPTYYSQQETSSSWSSSDYTGSLDTSVADGSRSKYTTIKGNGKDQTTIMVYMCGTDLESKSGMATNDLKEMASATYGDNINIIVYTGGCRGWKINGISAEKNQIYQVTDGGLKTLEKNMGSKAMTDPETLVEFINYCKKNFPANRNDLIFWDHGGGSITGYGYDEKYANSGSMTLYHIDKALSKADMKFDFIGFDACLMATAENALMLNKYADYLIASEETEPGIGWYYTNWLTAYGKNPSMDTLSIGKNIVDDFVSECSKKCSGQLTTLSVIDLAEFANTVPEKLKAFSSEAVDLIKNDEYQSIASARQGAREFATSTKIDQVDLVDLAKRLNTETSNALADALCEAVKYNRTSRNMTNAYGVSAYFPNRKLSSVNNAIQINDAIGMDDEYNKCIKEYASLQISGQSVATSNGNTGNPYASLFGSLLSSTTSTSNSDLTTQILESLLNQGISSVSGLDSSSLSFLTGRSMSLEDTSAYITAHQLDSSKLVWEYDTNGNPSMKLSDDQWALVTDLQMNMFYDDGNGYIDLGLDNVFTIEEDGTLIPETDKTWMAINDQPVAYYYMSSTSDGDNYSIEGYVPAMLNGERVKLLLSFDQDNPYGVITGAVTDYHDGETETVAKSQGELQVGDTLEFLCDYYSYDGTYQDTYYLGEPMTVTEEMEISNAAVGDDEVAICYMFTDIYGQNYWSANIYE